MAVNIDTRYITVHFLDRMKAAVKTELSVRVRVSRRTVAFSKLLSKTYSSLPYTAVHTVLCRLLMHF